MPATRTASRPKANVVETLDTGHYQRRRAAELRNPEFEAEYLRERAEIAQVDSIMRQLDSLREASGVSKAELARLIGRNPSTVRRLFTAEVNPELKTIAAIAAALGARLEVTVDHPSEQDGAEVGA
jgi:DNA-binding phage protein